MKISMRDFFGSIADKLFGGKTPEAEKPTVATPDEKVLSRRSFMKGIGAVGAVIAVEKLIPTAEAAERKLIISTDLGKTISIESIKEEEKLLEKAYEAIKTFSKEIKLNSSDRHSRTTLELDGLHDSFNAKFQDSIVNTLQLAKKLNDTEKMSFIYKVLKECNALGHFYKYTTELPPEDRAKINIDLDWSLDRFQSQASDYLPTGDEIDDSEIDPRVLQLATQYADGELLFPQGPRESVEKSIQTKPGWADPTLKEAFRAILGNKDIKNGEEKKQSGEIRELFISSDCSLAEVYSIIKAAIKTEQPEGEKPDYTKIISALLAEREIFKKKEILGSSTDTFIHFTLDDENLDASIAKQLGALATIWNKKDGDIVHEIKNDKRRGIKKYQPKEGELDPIITDLGGTIEKSRGNTLIYLSTHGSSKELGLHAGDEKNVLSTSKLAECLLRLVMATKNPKALENVTLLDSICHNYDFTKQLVQDLRAAYSGDPNELGLPTVITSSQAGSAAYSVGFGGEVLKNYLPAIAREKKLTGEFLMRRMQSEAYLFGDATFFTTKKDGKWQEIGGNESKPETSQTA